MVDFSNFFELNTDPMCVLSADMRCIKINTAFENVLGESSAAVEGKLFVELAHAEDAVANQKRIARFLKKRGHQQQQAQQQSQDQPQNQPQNQRQTRMTFRYATKADAVVWIEWRLMADVSAQDSSGQDSSAQVVYCMGRNVTKRIQQLAESQGRYFSLLQAKKAGRRLRTAAQQKADLYAQAIHNIPIGFFILRLDDIYDANSFRLVVSNPAASACTGVAIEASLGEPLANIFPNLRDSDVLERYVEVVRSGKPIDLGEVTYEDGRVERSTFSVKAFPLKENYVGVVFEDITLRKLREDDLISVNQLLTDAMEMVEHRNQELDQFAYVASHDLKAPLRAIASLATWIEEDLGSALPAENKEQFELLKSRVGRMEGLINGLLAYSRVGRVAQSREQVDVGEMLSEIVE